MTFILSILQKRILGINNKKSQIIYDIAETNNIELKKYLVSWSKKTKVKIDKLDSFSLNNLEFSMGEAKVKDDQLIFVAARDSEGNYIHRFILVSKKGDYKITKRQFSELVRGLRKVNENEFLPPRIKIITASSDENFLNKTIDSMNIQRKEAKLVFDILNKNYDPKNIAGRKIKIIY